MGLLGNSIISGYTLVMLCIMFTHSARSAEKNLQNTLYKAILQTTCLMLISDTLGRMDGLSNKYFPFFNQIGNFWLFILQPVVPALWVLYSHLNIFQSEARTKKIVKPLAIYLSFNIALTIINQFNGIYYYLDATNIYNRGPCYLLATSFGIVLTVIAFFMVVINRKIIRRGHFWALIFFPIIPMVAYVTQIVFYGYQLAISGIAISLLIVLLRIQNQTIHTDYLTGIYNRKWLDQTITSLISGEPAQLSLTAILIDLDDFKFINDTYGHAAGDQVLKDITQVLKTCLQDHGTVARYGGDEFYILIKDKDQNYVESLITQLRGCIGNYNKTNPTGYIVRFSVGYVPYSRRRHKTALQFQKDVDELLYRNKQEKRRRRDEEMSLPHE